VSGGGDAFDTDPDRHEQVVVRAGILKNLRVKLLDSAPGAGKTWTVTLVKNDGDQALTCTISNPDTDGVDAVNTVAVAVGDLIIWKITPANTPTATNMAISCEFVPS